MEKDSFLGGPTGDTLGFVPPENPPPYFQPSPQSEHSAMQQPNPPAHTQQTVIQVISSPIPSFGSRPANIRCPYCHQEITTKTKRVYTGSTHVCACLLSFVCCCCFAWVPYVTDCMNDIEHECPSCNRFLGVFARPNARR